MSIIRAYNTELTKGSDYSSLSSAATSADTTLSVYSIANFDIDQALLIGEFGQEGSEIVATHSATTPTGTTVTLSAAITKSHPKDTKVYIIPYNQVAFYSAATVDGAKTTLTTVTIDAEKEETTYSDTGTSGYYFARWVNSLTSTYGDYSDPIPYSGFSSNTVGYIINQSLAELNKVLSEKLTYDILISEVNSCLRYVRGKLKRWSNVQVYNYELDAALVENDYTWTLPTDYYDKNSNRSILQVWMEDKDNLTYVDKQEFDDLDRDADAGTPKYYTVYDGSIYITPKVGSEYAGDSIYMDYYTDIVEVNSDSDEITLARHDMVKHWLKWQIRNITENNGQMDFKDGDWVMFNQILADAIRRESSGQKYKMMPTINTIDYGYRNQSNFDTE
jgi:hypothetical protein